jgi:hypothetical protein
LSKKKRAAVGTLSSDGRRRGVGVRSRSGRIAISLLRFAGNNPERARTKIDNSIERSDNDNEPTIEKHCVSTWLMKKESCAAVYEAELVFVSTPD